MIKAVILALMASGLMIPLASQKSWPDKELCELAIASLDGKAQAKAAVEALNQNFANKKVGAVKKHDVLCMTEKEFGGMMKTILPYNKEIQKELRNNRGA